MSRQWCIDCLTALKANAGAVDSKMFEETIKYLKEDISKERIDALVAEIESSFLAEIHNDIDLGIHLGLSQVLSLIQKYIKEQTNE